MSPLSFIFTLHITSGYSPVSQLWISVSSRSKINVLFFFSLNNNLSNQKVLPKELSRIICFSFRYSSEGPRRHLNEYKRPLFWIIQNFFFSVSFTFFPLINFMSGCCIYRYFYFFIITAVGFVLFVDAVVLLALSRLLLILKLTLLSLYYFLLYSFYFGFGVLAAESIEFFLIGGILCCFLLTLAD